jgi:catechol 2,3-dioxygenase-like lactoylglutathione lyase family enzyme
MRSSLMAVTFDVRDPAQAARFWADMLGRNFVETSNGVLLRGDATQLGLGFAPCHIEKSGPNRVHLHITSTTDADQQQTVEKALSLGARHLDVGQRPEEGHVVLADPGDNEFCVIEPNNSFLANCGFLGELACDGGREVGLFWSQALGWPLVWDHDQETAIQSPLGGTKIAWGGPSVNPPPVTSLRQRFDLTIHDGDARGEVERLISLGASRIDENTLADPDGNEFRMLELDD